MVRNVSRLAIAVLAATALTCGAWTLGSGMALAPAGSGAQSDQAIAKAALLQLGDFSTGWRSQRRESSREGDEAATGISECKGLVAADKRAKKQPGAKSRKFVEGDNEVSNRVTVYKSDAAATNAFAVYEDENTGTCLEKVTRELLESNIEDDPAAGNVDEIEVTAGQGTAEPVGDAVVAYELEITVQSKTGASETANIFGQVVRVGRVVASYTFQSAVEPRADLIPGLINASLQRLQTSLGQAGAPAPS